MDAEGLYFDHPELMTAEEKEDGDYVPGSSRVPDTPIWYNAWSFNRLGCGQPDAEYRSVFEQRKPALSLNESQLSSLEAHIKQLGFLPVQQRSLFRCLRGLMLRQLISCDGCKDVTDLVKVLRAELTSSTPAPVPDWYKYSTVTMGPRRIGYYSCDARDCCATETLTNQFRRCGGCKLPNYCGTTCQKADWAARHKRVCREAKKRRDVTCEAGSLLQMLSDVSLTGGDFGGSLRDILAGHSTNERVKERRRHLKRERRR